MGRGWKGGEVKEGENEREEGRERGSGMKRERER